MTTGTNAVATLSPPRIAYPPAVLERFGFDEDGWRALTDAVWPLAKSPQSVILALSYCKARGLDPLKRPVHIVPVWSKEQSRMIETIWPAIGELRITAFRTREYAGRDETKFGPEIEAKIGKVAMRFPEWASVTVYRLVGGKKQPFVGPKVYWEETYAQAAKDDESPNAMWRKRAYGQLDKCAEAAALRAAFPEEMGDLPSSDEAEGLSYRTDITEVADAGAKVNAADFGAGATPVEGSAPGVTPGAFVEADGVTTNVEAASAAPTEPVQADPPAEPPQPPPDKVSVFWAKFWASDSYSLAKAKDFGAAYADAVARAPDRKRLQKLAMANSGALDGIRVNNPDLYKRLTDAAAERMNAIPVEAV